MADPKYADLPGIVSISYNVKIILMIDWLIIYYFIYIYKI